MLKPRIRHQGNFFVLLPSSYFLRFTFIVLYQLASKMANPKVPLSIIESCQRFFVAGISRSITSDDLRTHFSRFGSVIESRVQRDPAGLSLGYGWVGFDKPCPSLLDIEHRINGQVLDVQIPKSHQNQAPAGQHVNKPVQDLTPARPIVPAQAPNVPNAPIDRKRSRSRSQGRRHRTRSRDRQRDDRGPREDRTHDRPIPDRRPPPPGPPPPSVPQDILRANPAPYPVQHVQHPPRHISSIPPPPLGAFNEAEFFVCIPSSLCPPQYMRDPRVIFATMDPTGTMHQMQLPLGSAPPLPPQTSMSMAGYQARNFPPPPPQSEGRYY